MINDPKKLAEALKTMKVDGNVMNNVIKDVANNKDASNTIKEMAKDSNIKNTLMKNLSQGSRSEQPKLKDLRRMKKNMKNAMQDANADNEQETQKKGIIIMSNRKIKTIKINSASPSNSAETYFKSEEISVCYDLSDYLEDSIVLYSPSKTEKNRRIERLIGNGFGSEIIIYSENKDFIEQDLLTIEKMILSK